VPVETSVVSDVIERGAPRAVADTVKAGMLDHPLVQGPGARAFACVPLGSDWGNLGMVYVADSTSLAFRLHQIALLSAYANQAALAVQNARLYTEAVTRSEQVSTLHDVILTVTSTLDLDESLHRLAEAACRLLDVPVATIRLLDDSRQVLQARAIHGMPLNDRLAADLPVSRSLLGDTVDRRVPVASRDIWRDGRFQRRDLARALGLRSILVAPLVAKDTVLGVISVYTREPRDFGEAEIRLLRTLALEAGIAIENAQLYEQARERARFLSTLMQEAHHRVRNNLQVVSGLLAMQISQVSEESSQRILRQTIDRIDSIALVHEMLSQERVSEIDLKETATRIGKLARRAVLSAEQNVSVQVVGTRVCLPSRQATSAALTINELVNNALRHGFPDGASGTVTVSLQQQRDQVLVQVRDDGVGLPPGFDIARARGFGLDLVEGLVTRELAGTLALDSDHGTVVRLRFSAPPPSDQVVTSPTGIGQPP
jgi:two-component sensor histidine kinase